MSLATLNCKLVGLHCHVCSEGKADQVYITHDHKKLWPLNKKFYKITPGSDVFINVTIPGLACNEAFKIELWEYDFLSSDDLLGTFEFRLDEKTGLYSTDLKSNSNIPRYLLRWEAQNEKKVNGIYDRTY